MSTIELNNLIIDERIETGIALLRQHFTVEEKKIDPTLASPIIGGRPHHARRFNVEGIGNLLVMTVKDVPENQLSSFVITPYEKDLPLFSTDYVYSGERRFFLIELYDLVATHDPLYQHGIDAFAKLSASWDDMLDFRTHPCWYDDIRAVCIAKTPTQEQDGLALQRFQETLGCYIDMAQTLPTLTREQQREKWRLNKGYSDRLIDEGGVSTDLFIQALGPENTRRFFDEVFFASACYV